MEGLVVLKGTMKVKLEHVPLLISYLEESPGTDFFQGCAMFFRKHDRIWGLGSTKNSEKWCASFSKSVLKRWISVKKPIVFGFTNFETFTLELSAQHDCEWLYKTRSWSWNFGQTLSTMPTTFVNKVIHQTRKTSLSSREKIDEFPLCVWHEAITMSFFQVAWCYILRLLHSTVFSRKNWKCMVFGPA